MDSDGPNAGFNKKYLHFNRDPIQSKILGPVDWPVEIYVQFLRAQEIAIMDEQI